MTAVLSSEVEVIRGNLNEPDTLYECWEDVNSVSFVWTVSPAQRPAPRGYVLALALGPDLKELLRHFWHRQVRCQCFHLVGSADPSWRVRALVVCRRAHHSAEKASPRFMRTSGLDVVRTA